ncbi:MAG: hypothetical protein V3W37_03025 [Candidatus Binatia bacterium]
MSCITMLRVPSVGPMEEIAEFRNSWGCAMRIWNSLGRQYFGWETFPLADADKTQRFWKLIGDPRLSRDERLVLGFTWDTAICEKAHAGELAKSLRAFETLHPADGVSHLPAIAVALDEHAQDDCIGFAFIQTSVSSDVWDVPCTHESHATTCPDCGEEFTPESSRRFAWNKDKERGKHFFLFESYNNPTESEAEDAV